jgi:hypothetical protein
MMGRRPDPTDLAAGVAVAGVRTGLAVGRAALAPVRLATRAPLVGSVLQRRADDLAHDGRLARARALARAEDLVASVAAAPEVERVAARVLASADLDRVIVAILDHERTEQLIERALASAGLERLVIRVLESRLVDELTEQVLRSPELERVVEYVATSPQILDAVNRQTRTLADEMATNVRRRAGSADEAAERTVRGWLRRPRPQAT